MSIYAMNVFILLIIFGIVSECSSRKPGQATDYHNFIEVRSRNNVPETTFKEKMSEISRGQYGVLIMGMLLPSQKAKFCSNITQLSMTISLHNYTDALMECFRKEEKHIPKFINESYNEYLKVLCASNGKSIDDLFSSEANVCTENLKEAHLDKTESKLTLPLTATLTKNQICSDLKNIEKYHTDNLQKHCSNQTNYISVNNKILAAILKPCNAIEDTSEDKTK